MPSTYYLPNLFAHPVSTTAPGEKKRENTRNKRSHLENRVRFHRIHRDAGPFTGSEQVAPILRVPCTTPEDRVCVRDGSEGSWRLQPLSNVDLLQQFTRDFGVVDEGLAVCYADQTRKSRRGDGRS